AMTLALVGASDGDIIADYVRSQPVFETMMVNLIAAGSDVPTAAPSYARHPPSSVGIGAMLARLRSEWASPEVWALDHGIEAGLIGRVKARLLAVDVSQEAFPGPDEVDGFWSFDKLHAPRPITTLSEDLVTRPLAQGFTSAQAIYDSPIAVTNQHINYYLYASFHPLADEAEMADRLTRYHQTLEEKVPTVGRRWEEEWKPA
ncbi:MAG: hypothetical protein GY724_29130, partial [Actinomycetia bacterium]|nr:hypothetical protein [Actinomycetes bacterium]